MRAELAGRVDQISALHSERHQMQLEASACISTLCHVILCVKLLCWAGPAATLWGDVPFMSSLMDHVVPLHAACLGTWGALSCCPTGVKGCLLQCLSCFYVSCQGCGMPCACLITVVDCLANSPSMGPGLPFMHPLMECGLPCMCPHMERVAFHGVVMGSHTSNANHSTRHSCCAIFMRKVQLSLHP